MFVELINAHNSILISGTNQQEVRTAIYALENCGISQFSQCLVGTRIFSNWRQGDGGVSQLHESPEASLAQYGLPGLDRYECRDGLFYGGASCIELFVCSQCHQVCLNCSYGPGIRAYRSGDSNDYLNRSTVS